MTKDQATRALALLRSISSDIESMRASAPNYFGEFSESFDNGDGAYVEWPNLSITGRDIAAFLSTVTIKD